MARIDISPDIINRLKSVRIQNSIRANELAKYIGKTPAYISKLENGEFKTVDQESLEKIVNYITSDPNGYERFIDDFLKSASTDEQNNQLDMMRFDMAERIIPIPPSLIYYIKDQMEKLNISVSELTEYINKNDDYSDEFLNKCGLSRELMKPNYFYPIEGNDDSGLPKTIILYHVSEYQLDSILNFKMTSCPHVILFAVVYNLLKLRDGGKQSTEKSWKLRTEASSILTENKFYTILDKSRFFAQTQQPEEYKAFLNEQDLTNYSLINEMLEHIEYLSNYNINYTNEKLQGIVENMSSEVSFALSFMALPISKMIQLTSTQKREFLNMVNNIIEDLVSNPRPDDQIDLY